jgi:hypothetical protein
MFRNTLETILWNLAKIWLVWGAGQNFLAGEEAFLRGVFLRATSAAANDGNHL